MHIGVRPSRAAAGLLLVFAASHTFGGFLFPSSNGPAADAVLASMKSTHFDFFGSDCTFYGFHMGLGLMVSMYLVLSIVIAWILGDERVAQNPAVKEGQRPVAWALLVSHVGTMILSWKYFFVGPGVISTVVVLLLAWECTTTFRYH
jgi:uncharacterized membrane protein YedE/YeeE